MIQTSTSEKQDFTASRHPPLSDGAIAGVGGGVGGGVCVCEGVSAPPSSPGCDGTCGSSQLMKQSVTCSNITEALVICVCVRVLKS